MEKITIGLFLSSSFIKATRIENNSCFDNGCNINIYCCDTHDELIRSWRDNERILQAALFNFESEYFKIKKDYSPQIPCKFIEPDEADIYRTVLECQRHDKTVSCDRILIDSPAEGCFDEFSFENRPVLYQFGSYDHVNTDDWENQTIRKYRAAYESGCYDIILTKHHNLIPRLEALGIASRAVFSSKMSIAHILTQLALEAQRVYIRDSLPAYGIIGIRGGESSPDSLYKNLDQLNRRYNNQMLLTRRSGVCELGMSNLFLLKLTRGYTHCLLSKQLVETMSGSICIGWGIGKSLVNARLNAIEAYRESIFDQEHNSFLVNQDGNLIGPLNGINLSQNKHDSLSRTIREVSGKTGMSLKTLENLCGRLDFIGRVGITSISLAKSMGLSQRSASRILTKLEQHGFAKQIRMPYTSITGRPRNHYQIML
jgi:hypothetical protein